MGYIYPCNVALDEDSDSESYVVTFPEVYGATTGGRSREEALENGKDALVAALGACYRQREPIPLPSAIIDGQVPIALPIVPAAKVALNRAMQQHRVTLVELAKEMGLSKSAADKLCNPDVYSHFSTLEKALRLLGCNLVVEEHEKIPVRSPSKHPSKAKEPVALG